jgi:hypothetical protein
MEINNKNYTIFDNDIHTTFEPKNKVPDNFTGQCELVSIEFTKSMTTGAPMCKIVWRSVEHDAQFNHFLPLSDKTPWNRQKLCNQIAIQYFELSPEKIIDRCEDPNDEIEICQETINMISKSKKKPLVNIKREPQKKNEHSEKKFFDITILAKDFVKVETPVDDIPLDEIL